MDTFSFPPQDQVKSAQEALNWENGSQPDVTSTTNLRSISSTANGRVQGSNSFSNQQKQPQQQVSSQGAKRNTRPGTQGGNGKQENIDLLVKQLQQRYQQVNQRSAGGTMSVERGVLRPNMTPSSRQLQQSGLAGRRSADNRRPPSNSGMSDTQGDTDSLQPLKKSMYKQSGINSQPVLSSSRSSNGRGGGGSVGGMSTPNIRPNGALSALNNGFRPHATGGSSARSTGGVSADFGKQNLGRPSPPPSPPISPHRAPSQTERAKSSAAYQELRQKAELYNHAHMARFFNTQAKGNGKSGGGRSRDVTAQQVARHSSAASDSGVRYQDDNRSEISQDSERGPPQSVGEYGPNGFSVGKSIQQSKWYTQHQHQQRRASRHDALRSTGSGGSIVSRGSRSASIPISQRSPIIYETRVDVLSDEEAPNTPGGEVDESVVFQRHSSNGKWLTESEFATVLASYVDADEEMANRSSKFLFEQFTNHAGEGKMGEEQFVRAVTFIKLRVWQNLSHNFEGYYELFKFLDTNEDDLVNLEEFRLCFLLCAGFLRSMNRIPEKVDDDFSLSDENMVSQFVGLIFRILDVDEDSFVEEKAFCYGFKAGMGLLLLGQSQSLKRHQEWTVEEWMAFFDVVDFNNSGEIVMDEFLFGFQMLWGMNVNLSRDLEMVGEAYQKLEFQLIDRECRGSISSQLFVQQMQSLYQVPKRRSLPEYLSRRCFRLLDLDDSGHLGRPDIQHFIHCFQRSWHSREDAKTLEKYFRRKCDKYDYITEEKFVKYC